MAAVNRVVNDVEGYLNASAVGVLHVQSLNATANRVRTEDNVTNSTDLANLFANVHAATKAKRVKKVVSHLIVIVSLFHFTSGL